MGRLTVSGVATFLALILAGCGDHFGVGDFGEFAAARNRWDRSGIQDYRVDFRFQGFLNFPPGFVRLEVRGDQVISAVLVDSLPSQVPVPIAGIPTVSGLFERIASDIRSPRATTIDARYDNVLGFPRKVTVTCEPAIPDCGATYEMKNLMSIAAVNTP